MFGLIKKRVKNLKKDFFMVILDKVFLLNERNRWYFFRFDDGLFVVRSCCFLLMMCY